MKTTSMVILWRDKTDVVTEIDGMGEKFRTFFSSEFRTWRFRTQVRMGTSLDSELSNKI